MFLNLLTAYTDVIKDEEGNVVGYNYPDVWTSFAKDGFRSVFLWCAVVLAVLLLAVGFIVKWKKAEIFKSYLTVALSLAVGFALAVAVTMFSLEMMDMVENGTVYDLILYPSVVLAASIVLGAAAVFLCYLFGEKAFRIGKIAALSVAGAALIAVLVCMGVFYAQNIAEDGYYNSDVASVDQIWLYVSAFVLIAAIVALAFLCGKKDKKGFDSKSIAYAAICIAMSFALSYVRIFKLPQGGSVTIASLLPLMIYSAMYGTKKGVLAGLVYGILQAVQDPYIIHPAQFLLDYPIAFSAIGLAGMFSKVKALDKLPQVQFALGAVAASALRYVCHVLSGVFAFSAYAAEAGMNSWVYSLAYNSFVFADIAIVIAAGVLVFSSSSVVRQIRKVNAVKSAPKEEEAPDEGQN